MKYIGADLYIEWREAINCGISENTLNSAKARNSPSYVFIKDPKDKRKVLIEYESLKVKNKSKIKNTFGDPYEYLKKQGQKILSIKEFKIEAMEVQTELAEVTKKVRALNFKIKQLENQLLKLKDTQG